ncbi:MAG: ferredoxin family protein [Dehalococcoidia bacterium]
MAMKFWRTPLDHDKIKPVHGQVNIIPDRCKGCGFCIQFCPRHVLEESEEMNQRGYHFPYAARPDECAACGLCEALCPDFAISVTTEEAEKEKTGV